MLGRQVRQVNVAEDSRQSITGVSEKRAETSREIPPLRKPTPSQERRKKHRLTSVGMTMVWRALKVAKDDLTHEKRSWRSAGLRPK